jgi:hypothetical protein
MNPPPACQTWPGVQWRQSLDERRHDSTVGFPAIQNRRALLGHLLAQWHAKSNLIRYAEVAFWLDKYPHFSHSANECYRAVLNTVVDQQRAILIRLSERLRGSRQQPFG